MRRRICQNFSCVKKVRAGRGNSLVFRLHCGFSFRFNGAAPGKLLLCIFIFHAHRLAEQTPQPVLAVIVIGGTAEIIGKMALQIILIERIIVTMLADIFFRRLIALRQPCLTRLVGITILYGLSPHKCG